MQMNGSISEEQRRGRAQLKVRLEQVLLSQESEWKQRSGCSWVKDGDRNTKFVHILTRARQRDNSLAKLLIAKELCADPKLIQEHTVAHFSHQFSESFVNRPKLDCLVFRRLTVEQSDELVKPITEKRIDIVVKDCSGKKAPGPNGFTVVVLQKD